MDWSEGKGVELAAAAMALETARADLCERLRRSLVGVWSVFCSVGELDDELNPAVEGVVIARTRGD